MSSTLTYFASGGILPTLLINSFITIVATAIFLCFCRPLPLYNVRKKMSMLREYERVLLNGEDYDQRRWSEQQQRSTDPDAIAREKGSLEDTIAAQDRKSVV